MINIKIVVRNTNYDKTFVGLYSILMENCRETKDTGLFLRFLIKMGYAAGKTVFSYDPEEKVLDAITHHLKMLTEY